MDEFDTLPRSESTAATGHTTALFLSLYVLVLAFFIVLVTISRPEELKSRAVMDSLTSTFASLLPPSSELTPFASKEGDALAAQVFHDQIATVFATAVRVARVEVVRPGRLMRVTMPADSLFLPGTADIRGPQLVLLDRIVASLSVATPGLHYDLELLVGSATDDGLLPAGGGLEAERAVAFAEAMLARGAPPDTLAVALRPGSSREVVLEFFVRPADEMRLELGRHGRPDGTP